MPTANGQVDILDIDAVNEIANVSLLDPELQVEFEHITSATDRIKKLETELDEARSDFRCFLSETSSKVNNLSKKLGSCVEKAKLCREARTHARQWQSDTENSQLEYHEMLYVHDESEKVIHQLRQQLKKSINNSCLSARRSLLQLNNLANQHQLQLLPYFEMKAQFNQMFEEQIKKVPPLEDSDLKMNDGVQFHIENSSDEIYQQFQDLLDHNGSNDVHTKTSNSVASSCQDSLSSENVYLEHLTSEDTYMALPSNLTLTQGLINCSVSYSKSSNHHSLDGDSSAEDLSSKTSGESFPYNIKSNGFQHDKDILKDAEN